jgi:hypothetical protein
MPVYYIEVDLNDQNECSITISCNDPLRDSDAEIAQVLTQTALQLSKASAVSLH